MSERKYSVSEIDQMRENIRYIGRDLINVEEHLRTYMLNGTEPEELARACFDFMQQRIDEKRRNITNLRPISRTSMSVGY